MLARLLTASGQLLWAGVAPSGKGETPCEEVLSGGDNAPRGVFGRRVVWQVLGLGNNPYVFPAQGEIFIVSFLIMIIS
jgi:hypothetical protein